MVTDRRDEIVRRVHGAGYEVRGVDVGEFADVAITYRSDFRWSWLATKMHTFTFIAALDSAGRETLASFANACADYAEKNKPGLPRGLQTGSAAVTVAVVEGPSEDAVSWASSRPKRRFATMLFPALVDAETGTVTTVKKHLVWGAIYDGHFRRVLGDHVGRAEVAPDPSSARRVKLGYVLVFFVLPALAAFWVIT